MLLLYTIYIYIHLYIKAMYVYIYNNIYIPIYQCRSKYLEKTLLLQVIITLSKIHIETSLKKQSADVNKVAYVTVHTELNRSFLHAKYIGLVKKSTHCE